MSGKRFEKSFYMGFENRLQGMSDILKHEIKDKQNLSAHSERNQVFPENLVSFFINVSDRT
jgi:hypothetical protein